MGRKAVERRVPAESMLDLIPRIGRSVQDGRKELHTLLPHLSAGLAQAAQDNLKASEVALKALSGLGETVKDQADLLSIARRKAQAAQAQARTSARPAPATQDGKPSPG